MKSNSRDPQARQRHGSGAAPIDLGADAQVANGNIIDIPRLGDFLGKSEKWISMFSDSLIDPDGAGSPEVREVSYRCRNDLVGHRWSGSRRDTAEQAIHILQRLGLQGHRGVRSGLELVHQAFLVAKTGFEPIRTMQTSEAEWGQLMRDPTNIENVLNQIESGELQKISEATEMAEDQEWPDWSNEPELVQQELRRLIARNRASELFHEYKQTEDTDDLFEVTDWDEVEEEASPPLILNGLLYERGTLWISGAGGSGKTWLAYWILAELVRQEHTVGIYECESGATMIKGRLLNLGLSVDQIKTHIRDYRSADGNTATDLIRHGRTLAARMRKDGAVAALFDAAAPLLSASELDEDSAKDIRLWVTRALRPVTDELGALALVIDHTGHTEKLRPRGSSDKKPANDYMWVVETRKAFAIGRSGQVQLTCTKDRWGRIGENSTALVNAVAGNDESLTFLPLGWREPKPPAETFAEAFDGTEDTTEVRVLAFLGHQNRPCTSREIQDGTGLEKNPLQAALRRLKNAGKIDTEKATAPDGRANYRYQLTTSSDVFG